MTIAPVDSSDDLSNLVEKLSEHTEMESMGVGDESDDDDEEYIYEKQIDYKNPTIHFLKSAENIQEWLR